MQLINSFFLETTKSGDASTGLALNLDTTLERAAYYYSQLTSKT